MYDSGSFETDTKRELVWDTACKLSKQTACARVIKLLKAQHKLSFGCSILNAPKYTDGDNMNEKRMKYPAVNKCSVRHTENEQQN